MNDFVPYSPDDHGAPALGLVIRPATSGDAPSIARLLTMRGLTTEEALDEASRMIKRLPALLLALLPSAAETSASDLLAPVAVSGAFALPENVALTPGWMVSGLIVDLAERRRGIGRSLLASVVEAVTCAAPGAVLRSVVNATNYASVDLHLAVGFHEEAHVEEFAGVTFEGGQGVLLAI